MVAEVGESKINSTFIFLDRDLLLTDLKLGTHTEELKKIQKRLTIFTPAIGKCNFMSCYILKFRDQFHIDKLNHTD